jgi:hypothetical protein
MTIRAARKNDCAELAELVDIAGEGLPYYHWQQVAQPGQDPWEVGRERASRETGSFSYRNGVVADVDGRIVGALVGYPIAAEPDAIDTDSTPAMWIPLLELESIAAGTWYINTVAVFPTPTTERKGFMTASATKKRRAVRCSRSSGRMTARTGC